MNDYPIVKETDVMIATTLFLLKRGVKPYQFSVPRGVGIDTQSTQNLLLKVFENSNNRPNFVNSGPDIVGISEEEWWRVECKGSGKGKPPTQRNNFDRAVASVVSYYEEKVQGFENKTKKPRPFLGLALPKSPAYLNELKKRIRTPLRIKLNLWVLLYDPEENIILPVSPESEY